MRVEETIKFYWDIYCIAIKDKSTKYKGFIKSGTYYEIYVPKLNGEEILSLMPDDCIKLTCSYGWQIPGEINRHFKLYPGEKKRLADAVIKMKADYMKARKNQNAKK